ncbi:hypothetical protein WA1_44345 [Scytonema hofmannii PCC 7110]|uniref:PEP-CTERM protein-sorting domain-containing protein n=1 Tax=Scytonema hofmannii PCC 7110 TaxID=128403 RepID=A0A139WWC7_9CYAN|nr:hypothetical protein [Scytonema hofmannii]KYC36713.1 hypothetical protein WA1_44345 [Scytonema hofmannii PCC 7110]
MDLFQGTPPLNGYQIALDNFTFKTTKSVPEPISVLGLLIFGAAGATCVQSQQKRRKPSLSPPLQ